MSNAAATIPARRSQFNAKTMRIPALKNDNDTKSKKGVMKQMKPNNADILVVTHNHSNKNNNTNEEGYHRHFDDDQETLMAKQKVTPQSKPSPRSIPHASNGKLSTSSSGKNQQGDKKSTIKILHVQQYENLMSEREELQTQNEKYAERVTELEKEVARVLGEFSQLYEDYERLSRKMDTGKEPLIEPYSRVFEDRSILRAAEGGYKKRILRLETEVNEKQADYDKLQNEVKRLKEKLKPDTEKIIKGLKQKEAKMEKEVTKLQKDNHDLKSKVEDLEAQLKPSEKGREKEKEKATYTHKKPNIMPIRHEKVKKVKLTDLENGPISVRSKSSKDKPLENKTIEKPEVKREKFYYEYLLPDSLEY
ncbi:hypothetical protein ACF0H5_000335 [Mactra antiquata]